MMKQTGNGEARQADTSSKKLVLVTGSTAIDQTGVYPGSFDDYESRYEVKAFNASFQMAAMKTSFGGCAPNIAYGLHALGARVVPLSSAGRNFRDRYQAHLEALGIETRYIWVDDDVENCATCLMINDLQGNQIIGFYPGPKAPKRLLPSQLPMINEVGLAILGPEEPGLTLKQARDLQPYGIPIMFDPGQVTAEFSAAELDEMLGIATYLIVNEHELGLLCRNAGLTEQQVRSRIDELVVTHGEAGADIYNASGKQHVSAIPDVEIVEATGCGDAFRAGYAWGIINDLGAADAVAIGSIMAMKNLGAAQTQGYDVSLNEVLELKDRYYE